MITTFVIQSQIYNERPLSHAAVTTNANAYPFIQHALFGIYTADNGVACLHKRRLSIATLRKAGITPGVIRWLLGKNTL